MVALVTGSAGFIGSHICEELVKMGIVTVGIDDLSAGTLDNIKHLKADSLFKQVKVDVTDKEALSELFEHYKIDVIFHNAASKKNVCLTNPQRDCDVNAKGTLNLLQLAHKHKISKFVHASTGSVYGEPVYIPQNETHPLNPASYYGVSKLAGERYVNVFHQLYGMNTTILRYFHVIGERQSSHPQFGGVVSIFINKIKNSEQVTIFGDGTQERSFTYVKDVVNANIQAWKNPASNGQVYNCASGIKVTVSELADDLMELMNNDVGINYKDWMIGDIKVFDIDNFKIKRDFNLEFTEYKESLRKTLRGSNAV